MKGFGVFLIGFGVAAALSALTIWVYDVSEITMTERVDAPGVRLLEPDAPGAGGED